MILQLESVNSFYGGSHILFDMALSVKEGQTVAFLGRNGAGKSTTMMTIMGFVQARSGSIRFRGKEIIGLKPHIIANMGIALVPEDRRIFTKLTVEENLLIASKNLREEGWSLEKIYSFFPIIERRKNNKGYQLSGGEQQILTIARALMTNSHFMLLDEPSEGLAPVIVQAVGSVIAQLREQKLSVLLAEQNINFALKYTDYAFVIDDGKLVYEGLSEKLKKNEEVKIRYLAL